MLVGFLLLIKGGDYLVQGAVAIAKRAKLDAMVIGLTIVAFGTSAPELLVSLQAAWQGSSGIALGNVIGSNIANIALILGVTALISPVPVKRQTLRVDMPFLLCCSILVACATATGLIERWHGIFGLCLLIGFVTWQIRTTRRKMKQSDAANTEPAGRQMHLGVALLLVAGSCAALTYGADFLVRGASEIARIIGRHWDIPAETMERIIGLTIVAIGTSLPELFASISAARKGETDMAIGNVIGSNIFNVLCVICASAAITPIHVMSSGFAVDYMWMIGLTALLWYLLRTDYKLSRTEGVVLLVLYVGFLGSTLRT
jgi:cation:H+ antiporter